MKKLLLILPVPLILAGFFMFNSYTSMGNPPSEEHTAMYASSPNFQDGLFVNAQPIDLSMGGKTFSTALKFFLSNRKPPKALPVLPLSKKSFPQPPAPLQVAWLGHSSLILDLDGVRILIDPVFGNASPVPWTVSRFQDPPLKREDLPEIDLVVISHDHYDHLEMATVKHLIPQGAIFLVPLGVGSHLERWGCPTSQIKELDWGQSHTIKGVKITATPSRHFSGRGFSDRNKTLWASWVFAGPKHRAFYSSDGGFDQRFEAIGKEFGPFDLTMIEIGAWNKDWADVHLFPEQAVDAHLALGGKHLLPVHWATFELSLHQWDDPILRASKYAAAKGAKLFTPKMGQLAVPGQTATSAWWAGESPGS